MIQQWHLNAFACLWWSWRCFRNCRKIFSRKITCIVCGEVVIFYDSIRCIIVEEALEKTLVHGESSNSVSQSSQGFTEKLDSEEALIWLWHSSSFSLLVLINWDHRFTKVVSRFFYKLSTALHFTQSTYTLPLSSSVVNIICRCILKPSRYVQLQLSI